MGIWNDIHKTVCENNSLSAPWDKLLLTRAVGAHGCWLVGPHPDLSSLATKLRDEPALCLRLHEAKVRFGFRATDVPPLNAVRQERYGNKVFRKGTLDFQGQRLHQMIKTAKELKHPTLSIPPPNFRKSDLLVNVGTYWATQTPQAHHIVEFNNLAGMGLSTEGGSEELDYDQLPCVLLMAEFHQRYISSVLKQTHFRKPKDKKESLDVVAQLRKTYQGLYQYGSFNQQEHAPLGALWEISDIVFKAVEAKLV